MTTLTKVREIASCHREASEGFARWREQLHKAIREARQGRPVCRLCGCPVARVNVSTEQVAEYRHLDASEAFACADAAGDRASEAVWVDQATLGQLAQATGYTRQRISQIVKEA